MGMVDVEKWEGKEEKGEGKKEKRKKEVAKVRELKLVREKKREDERGETSREEITIRYMRNKDAIKE